MTDKIRSGCGPLIRDHEERLGNGGIAWIRKDFWVWEFWGKVRRRGTHVFPPEIGSRGDVFCFWGN
jgi:hypothetical protein